jgi:hypothetical protein
MTSHSQRRIRVAVKNEGGKHLTLCVEPWASELDIPPGVELLIEFRAGNDPDVVEVCHTADRITVFGWSGSVFAVYRGSECVLDVPIPSL